MAHKRMFSKDITNSDAFRDMPSSTQNLYFHLGMEADDDGFLGNYKSLMRGVGATEDDLKILVGKRFLLVCEDGVMVIKHWLINNTIRKDRYTETKYLEQKNSLFIKENGAYTDVTTTGIPTGNQLATQKRIGKDRKACEDLSSLSKKKPKNMKPYREPEIDLDTNEEIDPVDTRRVKDKEAVYALFSKTQQPWFIHAQQRQAALRLFDRGIEKVKNGLKIMKENEDDKFCPQASTPFEYEKKLPQLQRYLKKNA